MFVFVVSAGWCTCLSARAESPANHENDLTVRSPGVFDSYETMRAELAKLREAYKPFMRSLPSPLDVREQVPVAGKWRFAYEVEPFELKAGKYVKEGRDIPPAEKWFPKDFDDSLWETVTVPEWRYQRQKAAGWRGIAPTSVRWYRTSFSKPILKAGRRLFLVFQGVGWSVKYI